MVHPPSEDSLAEQSAIQLFVELGWQTVSVLEEVFGVGGALGRETKGEAVLVPRLRAVHEDLNPSLPPDTNSQAIGQRIRDRSAMSLAVANREVYDLLKEAQSSHNLGSHAAVPSALSSDFHAVA